MSTPFLSDYLKTVEATSDIPANPVDDPGTSPEMIAFCFDAETQTLSFWDPVNEERLTISLGDASLTDTDDLPEGATNLYYTAARFNTAFAAKSTTDLSEGSNLYFTNERVDDRVNALLQQGSNVTLTYDDGANTLTIAASSGSSQIVEPQGRLTNSTGVPLLTSAVTGAGTVYYTPYKGNLGVFPGASALAMSTFTELSQALSDNTKSPAAAAAWRCYDMWLWDDGGTQRCTRGPGWTDGGRAVTVTVASPSVFTLNNHGFFEGQPVILATDGTLPTGFVAGTIYFVTATSLAANTFTLAATAGDTAINGTVGQSGNHTVTTHVQTRGTGAGTEEHDTTTYPGWIVNEHDITNGPAAGRGFYVGTILTNGSSQVDMFVGVSIGAGGAGNIVGIWNAYQQEEITSENRDNTNTWTYTTATHRMKNGNFNNRIIIVSGKTRPVKYFTQQRADNSSSQARIICACLNSSTATLTPGTSIHHPTGIVGGNIARQGSPALERTDPLLGMNWYAQTEWSEAVGTSTWYGDNNSANTIESYSKVALRA